jgi:hypothetical protein
LNGEFIDDRWWIIDDGWWIIDDGWWKLEEINLRKIDIII